MRSPRELFRGSRTGALLVIGAWAVLAGGTAFAASLGVTSGKLTGWHSATAVVCVPSSTTLTATADTYVDEASASTNFGTDTTMKVRSQLRVVLVGGNARALVRFVLPTAPDLCSFSTATLRLNTTSVDSGRTLQALRVTQSWIESGGGSATWNAQPTTTSTAAATTASASGYIQWTVTTQVASMYAGTNNGFLIKDLNENAINLGSQQVFSSRQAGSNPPQLVVTFA